MDESTAYDEILDLCRHQPGRVMRYGVMDQPACRVLDMRCPVSSELVVEAATWLECHSMLFIADDGAT